MRLPPPANPGPIFAISIHGSTARPADTVRLAGVLADQGMAATWGVATVADADVIEAAVRPAVGHDLALDYPSGGEADGQRAMLSNLRTLRQAGLTIQSILCPFTPESVDSESLARLGIRVVAIATLPPRTRPVTTLRFGLWGLATAWHLPGDGWLGNTWGAARGRRLLEQAMRRNAPFHIMIDAGAIENKAAPLRGLERLLHHVDRRRAQGALNVVTLTQFSQQLTRRRASATAQSILRVRAA